MGKTAKKWLAMLLAICMMTSALAGCGASKPAAPADSGAVQEDTVPETPANQEDASSTKVVTDMRGKEVTIPADPQRVAIFDKGFLVQSMRALGVLDKICATGGLITEIGDPEQRDSMYLFPEIMELPIVGYPTDAVDFETLAAAAPDLVILRNSEYIKDSEITADAINKIENDLGLPLVVINGPGCYDVAKLEHQYEGLAVLGEVFDKQERAEEIVAYMKEQVALVQERTASIADADKPSVMYIGLRNDNGVGVVWGENFGDAKFSTEYANIKNVYEESARTQMSAEQIITLDPEVIILCTNSVRPNPDILTTDPTYENLKDVSAVKNGRVTSIGLLTWWGDFRLEFPTILLIAAKSAYPEQFEDINVSEWLDEYHQALYGLDDAQAQRIKEIQQLDWMDSHGF